jgi:hypothetical protein
MGKGERLLPLFSKGHVPVSPMAAAESHLLNGLLLRMSPTPTERLTPLRFWLEQDNPSIDPLFALDDEMPDEDWTREGRSLNFNYKHFKFFLTTLYMYIAH